ncbi:MAG: DUF3352 domain-containing protein [Anaerolineae bacterium]|nr:DUF3352 domain-containing protein [Anaerolineae bacterium]
MIRRTLCLVVLLALTVGAVGLGTAPATAAPHKAAVVANADLLPADTAVYFDLKTGDWEKTVNFVLDTVQKVTGTRPNTQMIYGDIDRSLTQALDRPATFEKDILSWLGDHLTVGFRVTDQLLADIKANSPNAQRSLQSPEFLVLIQVKDDAAAQTFIIDTMTAMGKSGLTFANRTETIGGNTATIYDQSSTCFTTCASIALTKGLLVIGTKQSVADMGVMINDKKPTLNDDANFNKVAKALKPDNLMTLAITPRAYSLYLYGIQMSMAQMRTFSSSAATPDPTADAAMQKSMQMAQDAVAAIEGQAIAARMDGKVLALDVAQSVNMQALTKVYATYGMSDKLLQNLMFKPIDVKLAEQIPTKALAALVASGLPGLYDGIKEGLKLSGALSAQMTQPGRRNQMDAEQITKAFDQFEAFLKLQFNLDVHDDILSWMNGEFALYMLFNPTGTLAKASRSQWPFDHVLLIQTGDAAKTTSFLTKLNAGLEANAKLKPEAAGDNLFRLTVGSGTNAAEIGYGLIGNTFVVATGTALDGAGAAVKGDGILSGSAAWKNAQASMIKPTTQVWFVNFTEIAPIIKALATVQGSSNRSDTKAALAVLDMLESASITTSPLGADGVTTSSAQIVLK